MRKISPRYRRWLIFQAKKGIEKTRREFPGARIALLSSPQAARYVRILSERSLPAIMCLDRNFTETIETLTDLRQLTSTPAKGRLLRVRGRRKGRIGWVRNATNFRSLQNISAGAALMLASEYDRIANVTGNPPATLDIDKWNPSVKATLAALGFFDLLNLKVDVQPSDGGLIIEPMISGSDVNMEPVNAAIASLFAKGQNDPALRLQLASAVTDAVENVRGHAYPDGWIDHKSQIPRWWFTGALDPAANRVTLGIFDQGISIPMALPLKWEKGFLKDTFKRLFSKDFDPANQQNDGQAIAMAMQLGTSSTNLPYRGKGLPKILEIIRACPKGRLRVVSRCGECIYTTDGESAVQSYATPLMGTYIELEALFAAPLVLSHE